MAGAHHVQSRSQSVSYFADPPSALPQWLLIPSTRLRLHFQHTQFLPGLHGWAGAACVMTPHRAPPPAHRASRHVRARQGGRRVRRTECPLRCFSCRSLCRAVRQVRASTTASASACACRGRVSRATNRGEPRPCARCAIQTACVEEGEAIKGGGPWGHLPTTCVR